MDPPAYTPTQPATPTTTQRAIEDTRALILSHAQTIRPRLRIDGPIAIVVGKTRPPLPATAIPTSRSFTHSASNTTIRISEPSEPRTNSRRPSGADAPNHFPAQRQRGKHYAALVARSGVQIQQILRGEAQDTIEEALEWLLDRTEIIVDEMLDKHGKQMTCGCCVGCDRVLGVVSSAAGSERGGYAG